MSLFRVALVCLSLGVVGCQTASGVREPIWPYPQPPAPPSAPTPPPFIPPGGEGGVGSPTALPQTKLPQARDWPRDADAVSGPAVRSLMAQSQQSQAAGRQDEAIASLERAVRIEPRNAFLWSALARAQLKQANYEQAEAMAQRANSLSGGNPYIQVDNWRVIAAARNGRGDAAGGLQAQARLEELQAGLPPE